MSHLYTIVSSVLVGVMLLTWIIAMLLPTIGSRVVMSLPPGSFIS